MKTKELTIEEKAKAYDEALERAKELLEIGLKDTRDKRVVLSFFPELAKSEDERIREKVIATIHLYYGEPLEDEAKEMIYWLEKQGQAFSKKDIDDAYLKGICDAKKEFERQGEQKPILDVEIPFGAKDSELEEVSYSIPNGYHAEIEDNKVIIKKGEQKSSWSEEDEREVDILKAYICSREWSDSHIDRALGIVDELVKKLKSLRPQSHWKPSEEQLHTLEKATHIVGSKYKSCLKSLYQDLQKLMEE